MVDSNLKNIENENDKIIYANSELIVMLAGHTQNQWRGILYSR